MTTEEIINFTFLGSDIQTLIQKAIVAREYSYSPYSNFKVGAAILCNNGVIFTGCNVENASYPATICAERTAIAKAVSEGRTKFKAIAVIGEVKGTTFTTPCGICRQTIAEFGDVQIYLTGPELGPVLKTRASRLLPHAFVKKHLLP